MARSEQWIEVCELLIKENSLVFTYTDFAMRNFSVELQYSQSIMTALSDFPPKVIHRLINYLAITQSLYFFNYTYYDKIIAYYELDEAEVAFFQQLVFAGMAEFRYINHLEIYQETVIRGKRTLPRNNSYKSKPLLHGAIVLNGGGKDGAVAAETLRASGEALTWLTLNKEGMRGKIIEASTVTEQMTIGRIFVRPPADNLMEGHKPLSAELGFHAALAAIVNKKRYAVVGNEYSANDPNLIYDNFVINHQYTKSYQFEKDLSDLLDRLDLGIHYFSVLRPLYELQILKIFEDFPQYHQFFISCNRGVRKGYWCLACDKCAFLVLALSAISPAMVEKIWGDRLLIANRQLRTQIISLVSPDGPKPFDCVGTLAECQLALGMVSQDTTLWQSLPADFREAMQPYIPHDIRELEKQIMGSYDREEHIPDALRENVFSFFSKHLGV